MKSVPDSGNGALTVELAGASMVLLGARAMYWPARKRLLIADLHLGKSHVFRRAGIAVPRGGTQQDLQRLTRVVAAMAANELWIVGDVLHGPAARADWRDAWIQWRERHARLEVAVLAGNHDRALNGASLRVRQLGQACGDGPFLFCHLPQADSEGRHVIAGHVHPTTRVPGVPRNWPAFWFRQGVTVLPAFSEFTGGHVVDAGRGDALVACVEGQVLPLGFGGATACPAPSC